MIFLSEKKIFFLPKSCQAVQNSDETLYLYCSNGDSGSLTPSKSLEQYSKTPVVLNKKEENGLIKRLVHFENREYNLLVRFQEKNSKNKKLGKLLNCN